MNEQAGRRGFCSRLAAAVLTLAAAAVLFCGTVFAAGDGARVYDEAGLFTAEEAAELESTAARLRELMNMDVVVVTTDDAMGKSAEAYADDFYDEGGFGVGKDASGVLYLIDMDNREVWISTCGTMIRFLTDARIDSMLDHAFEELSAGDYIAAARGLLEDTEVWYGKGIPGGQYNYDRDTGQISRYRSIRWYEVLIALAVSVFCGAAACLNVKREYAMKRERGRAAGYRLAYRANAHFAFRVANDVIINSFVTQQRIVRSNTSGGGHGGRSGGRSTVHRSSSGRSHGGGGRRF